MRAINASSTVINWKKKKRVFTRFSNLINYLFPASPEALFFGAFGFLMVTFNSSFPSS
jgi:hypothetical protein